MAEIKKAMYASIQIDAVASYRDLQRTLTELKKELAGQYKQIRDIKPGDAVELDNVFSALVHIQKFECK